MQNDLTPGFMVLHGNRLEDLRSLVVDWMQANPLHPLENEVFLVQSNGIAQWLKLALAEPSAGGIAAAVQVELPARFLWENYRRVLGSHTIPERSPLDKEPLTWRLLRLLPSLLEDERFSPLRHFLADDADLRKRYQLAERLADLFDQYQVYRADWLADWAQDRDQLRTRKGECALEAEQRWQPALWRALLADVGHQEVASSRAGVHPRFVEALANAEHAPAGLPRRVIVFGISSLPAQTVEALAAMARFCQVLLCVSNPCRHYWGDIITDQALLRAEIRRHARKAGQPDLLAPELLHQHAHPLLAAWGKQGRDYLSLLDQYDNPDAYRERFSRIDIFDIPEENNQPTHLLGQLQNDILELRPLAETRTAWPVVSAEKEMSLRFHLAHSAQREVEILHDQLLARFSADPSLRPRDIIVMVPDINVYAPHIEAVFGQHRHKQYGQDYLDERYIPFTLADQSQRGREPLLVALEYLLHLPERRLTVSEVLDLLDVAALRARFGLHENDLPILHRWITGAGVRWGLNAAQRTELGMPAHIEQNSWRFGLRRMLLGYAVGRSEAFDDIEPFDEVGGLEAALVGPLVTFLDTLEAWYHTLSVPMTVQVWHGHLQRLLDDFFAVETDTDSDVLERLRVALDDWQILCTDAGLAEPLPLGVVREAWLGRLDLGRLSQRFLAGAVNFCTLMPMRAIPFRMVCVLGMNDGAYPRSIAPLDFDLMAREYRPGDRSRREDDRYLLLEALLAAREQLYISWIGRSIRDNSACPPSVLIGQLRDHLAAGWQLAPKEGTDLLAALTTEHPLQPFSPRCFTKDAPSWSYAREWMALHEPAPMPVLPEKEPLAEWSLEAPLTPEQLARFLRNPVEFFFKNRLKVFFESEENHAYDDEPFTLNALENHTLRQTLLDNFNRDLHDGKPVDIEPRLDAHLDRLARTGGLPLAGFKQTVIDGLKMPLQSQLERFRELLARYPHRQESPAALHFAAENVAVAGWLGELRQLEGAGGFVRVELFAGQVTQAESVSKFHRLLLPWVRQVLAAACAIELHQYVVAEDKTLYFAPLEAATAHAVLSGWLAAWREGMRHPLPVAIKTAFEWFPKQNENTAATAYEGSDYNGSVNKGEVAESPYLARQYPDFAALTACGEWLRWSETLYGALYHDVQRANVLLSEETV